MNYLHNDFVNLKEMDVSNMERVVNYRFSESPFGKILLGYTFEGLCYLAFYENKLQGINLLKERFPMFLCQESSGVKEENIQEFFKEDTLIKNKIDLHVRGTDFQIQVWKELLKIPFGGLSTYGEIAQNIGKPKASRAIGTAIGRNPIAFIVPCHRVVQTSGKLGGYMWGTSRKKNIIDWETAQKTR